MVKKVALGSHLASTVLSPGLPSRDVQRKQSSLLGGEGVHPLPFGLGGRFPLVVFEGVSGMKGLPRAGLEELKGNGSSMAHLQGRQQSLVALSIFLK